MHHLDDLARYKERVRGRVAGSENLGTRPWYREAFGRGAIDVAHFDVAWIGGLTEGRKVAALAETFDRPIAPHDCTGPVVLVANTHLVFATPNALILETVRAHLRSYYQDLVTDSAAARAGLRLSHGRPRPRHRAAPRAEEAPGRHDPPQRSLIGPHVRRTAEVALPSPTVVGGEVAPPGPDVTPPLPVPAARLYCSTAAPPRPPCR